MIRVTFAYPHEAGKKFDWNYFSGKHLPLVHEHLDPLGLTKVEADKGISGTDPSSKPPFEAVVHMTFGTVDEVHEAFKAAGTRGIQGGGQANPGRSGQLHRHQADDTDKRNGGLAAQLEVVGAESRR